MLNFTLTQIETMIIKGSNRTLSAKESAKMLNDIKGMTEKDANTYLKLWSSLKWFNERMNGKFVSNYNRMGVLVSCKENSDAYINFLADDVKRVK